MTNLKSIDLDSLSLVNGGQRSDVINRGDMFDTFKTMWIDGNSAVTRGIAKDGSFDQFRLQDSKGSGVSCTRYSEPGLPTQCETFAPPRQMP